MKFDNYQYTLHISSKERLSRSCVELKEGKLDLDAHPWMIDALKQARYLIDKILKDHKI